MNITCPQCGMTSHNLNDELYGYCSNCGQFHELMKPKAVKPGWWKSSVTFPTWQVFFIFFALGFSMVEGAMDLYEYWTYDRVLNNCIEQKLYRCDIDETTKIFITYANNDMGPDE